MDEDDDEAEEGSPVVAPPTEVVAAGMDMAPVVAADVAVLDEREDSKVPGAPVDTGGEDEDDGARRRSFVA